MSILCYHAVDPAWDSSISVHPATFSEHCRWLLRARRLVPLAAAVAGDRPGRVRGGAVALTFDDGFSSVHEHAFPVLRRMRIPATLFVVVQTLTEGRAVDWVDDPPDHTLTTLSTEQVLEMQDAGISFGSHSYSHRMLTELTDEECLRDLRESRTALGDLLHDTVSFVAYPRGAHDERVRRAAERAGFTRGLALPETSESTGPFAVPRIGVHRHNGRRILWAKTSSWYLEARTSRAYRRIREARRRVTGTRTRLPA